MQQRFLFEELEAQGIEAQAMDTGSNPGQIIWDKDVTPFAILNSSYFIFYHPFHP